MTLRWLLARLAGAVPVLIGISLLLFLVIHLAPGGPMDVYADNPSVTPAALARIAEAYGLNQPLPVQYGRWLQAMLTGDWGYSIRTGRPVLTEIAERLGPTLLLGSVAMAAALILSVALGVLAAARVGRWPDRLVGAFTLAGLSLPVFWVALVMQLLFSVWLGILPSGGLQSIGVETVTDRLAHLVMPATVLGIATTASWSRYIRAAMITVLAQDYIRTARAYGLGEVAVLLRHGLRNAIIPATSIIALDLASVISGAVITEAIFSWPGIGSLFMQSMDGRDYPVLMGVLMMGSAAVIIANIAADLLQALLDPRIRHG